MRSKLCLAWAAAAALLLAACGGGDAELDTKTAAENPAPVVQAFDRAAEAATAKVAPVPGNLLNNPGFESGDIGWVRTSTGGNAVIVTGAANTGSRLAVMGGKNSITDTLGQDVALPLFAPTVKLSFWYRIVTEETTTLVPYDKLSVEVYTTAGAKLATLGTLSNLEKSTNWARSPLYDLSPWRGQTVRLRFTLVSDSSRLSSFHLDDVAVAPLDPAVTQPVTGWWWNPAESGRGFAIERQGDLIYLSAFLYETTGEPVWYVSTLARQQSGLYKGAFVRYAGGQTLLGNYQPPSSNTSPGNATLVFDSASTGTLELETPGNAYQRLIAIQRFPISSPAFRSSKAGFESGWWWSETEGGRGYFIEVQDTSTFIGSFMYEGSGAPVWYVSAPALQNPIAIGGPLQRYMSGQALTGQYRAPVVTPGDSGSLGFEFSNGWTGNLVLSDGRKVPIRRFSFNPANAPVGAFAGIYVTGADADGNNAQPFMRVNSVGTISGLGSLDGDNAETPLSGTVAANGTLTITGIGGGGGSVTVTGTIDGAGKFSGTYNLFQDGQTFTFPITGSRLATGQLIN